MAKEAKRLVKALRNSYGYSERRDHEAAGMIESLSTRLEFTQGLFEIEKEQFNKAFNVISIWKHRAEAAERDLHSIIKQVDDGCRLCAHHQPCRGKDCPEYISGKGAIDKNGEEYPNFPWTCEEFDFGTCPLLENTPCSGCDFENHWQWRGPCEENGGMNHDGRTGGSFAGNRSREEEVLQDSSQAAQGDPAGGDPIRAAKFAGTGRAGMGIRRRGGEERNLPCAKMPANLPGRIDPRGKDV